MKIGRLSFTLTDLSAVILGLIVIQLPVYQLYISISFGVWILVSLTAAIIERNKPKVTLALTLPSILYLVYALGLLWTEDRARGGFDLEVKMSLIIIPFVFLFLRYQVKHLKIICWFLFVGLIFSMMELFWGAFISFKESGLMSDFFYVNLSHRIHPSYLSFYVNIALSVVVLDYYSKTINLFKKEYVYLVLALILLSFSVVLISKIGVFTSVLIAMLGLVFMMLKKRWILALSISLAAVIGFVSVYKSSPYVQTRIGELLTGVSTESTHEFKYSTTLRKEVWKCAYAAFLKSKMIGHGTGDVQAELNLEYEKIELNQARILQLNSHNQYLQTAVSLGLMGLFVLVSLVVYPIFRARKNEYFGVGFSIITLLFFATESVLETQAGVVGFIVFYSLLNSTIFLNNPNETSNSNPILSA